MGNLNSAKRKLNAKNVWVAQETNRKKIAFVKRLIEERAKKDAEFARDVLKYVGENLPIEARRAAEETIRKKNEEDELKANSYGYNLCANSDLKLKDISFDSVPTELELETLAET